MMTLNANLIRPLKLTLALNLVFFGPMATTAWCQAAEGRLPPPRYYSGQTLHYQIDFRTQTSSHTAGFVSNPQGASQISLSANLLLRLEVLFTLPATTPDSVNASVNADLNKFRRARMRATYEKSDVVVHGDSYDPAVATLEKQYRQLEGHAVEFTLEGDGRIDDVSGLGEISDDPHAAAAIRGWLTQLAAAADFPSEGIALGHTWSQEKQMTESPLAGTVLRGTSTYVRDEACRESTAADSAPAIVSAPAAPEQCAVIVTRSEMKQEGTSKNGQTPDAFRLRGLRSSGTWTSVAESLAYLSLRTGLTVSITQTGADEMNMTITSTNGGEPIRYIARTRSETHVTLLPEAAPSLPPAP